jgi:hypothetical protein
MMKHLGQVLVKDRSMKNRNSMEIDLLQQKDGIYEL